MTGIGSLSLRVKGLGNAVVPQCALVVGRYLVSIGAQRSLDLEVRP